MKKLVLAAVISLLLVPRLFAPWAARLVISPGGKNPMPALPKDLSADKRFVGQAADLARKVSVSPGGPNQLVITIKDAEEEGASGKGFFLVVCKKRRLADALDFRHVLGAWKMRHRSSSAVQEAVAKAMAQTEGGDSLADIAEVRPIPLSVHDGESALRVVLSPEAALRSYIVWDYKAIYEAGALVMDGGLWLTYDVPAFIEAATRKAPAKPE